METLTLHEISQALGVRTTDAADGVTVRGVSIDSRTALPGDLFFAIRGQAFDGHRFVGDAFSKGAAAVVISERGGPAATGGPALAVEDTVAALQSLATFYRRRFGIPVVAVTGTNGKTTTKDMIAAALGTTMNVMKTEGNKNNHIGVPLTLFRLSREHGAAVVEMGMNHAGEIARLAAIARPTVGVITNVAEGHLETMNDLDAVADAKGELLDALPADGAAILNEDDPRVMSQSPRARCRIETFGLGSGAGTRGVAVLEDAEGVSFELEGDGRIELPVPGRHNVRNALAALAVAKVLGVASQKAAHGLAAFEPAAMRTAIVDIAGWTVLNDAYNANPGSLGAALETLASVGRGRITAAALGDMLELGARSRSAHREAGLRAAGLGIKYLFLFGTEVQALREGALAGGMSPDRALLFEDKAALARAVRRTLGANAVLLVKGSRGMRMEEVVELLAGETPVSS
jgi:UDP-N-acetylmuramoyl-tripeptide--D-alanyl-D-alanine ligase